MSTSPPALIQKSRIDSPVPGTILPTEIESLKYEPEEDSEEFYVDMGTYVTDTQLISLLFILCRPHSYFMSPFVRVRKFYIEKEVCMTRLFKNLVCVCACMRVCLCVCVCVCVCV